MIPSITPDDFRLFLDGTGKPFTEFLDSVLRANAAKLSISPADVHTNIRVNVPDGGVDTQVASGNDPMVVWQARHYGNTRLVVLPT
jgi:hypothetical protein